MDMELHLPGLLSSEQAAKATGVIVATLAELVVTPLVVAYDASKKVNEIGAGVFAALTGCGDAGDQR